MLLFIFAFISCSTQKIKTFNETKIIEKINSLQSTIDVLPDQKKLQKREKIEQLNQALFRAAEIYCQNTIHHLIGHATWQQCMSYGKRTIRDCERIRQVDKAVRLGDCLKETLYSF